MTSLVDAWLECRQASLDSASIAACILERYPELVDEWLRSTALTRLTAWISDQERRQRQHHTSHVFTEAAAQFERDGDDGVFLATFAKRAPFIDKMQGELRRDDIRVVINGYTETMLSAELLIRVWKKIYRKVGLRRVDEVFTEEEFDALFGFDDPKKEQTG